MPRRYEDDIWYDGAWPRYVPVSERREVARRQVRLLRMLGLRAQPVEPTAERIAASVWGRTWCHHLESFSDLANRLPRGRSYVRHGAVVHLELEAGMIRALVHGSETYHVEISVQPLDRDRWQAICNRCQGRIDSLLAVLEGRLDDDLMALVAHRTEGLLPLPGEIGLACSCPDIAVMCKHVAAALYGVGRRLDTEPALLFELRGVTPDDLLTGVGRGGPSAAAREDDLADDADFAELFGVELDDGTLVSAEAVRGNPTDSPPLDAEEVRALRRRLGDTVAGFAARVKVAPATVYRWEKASGRLRMWSAIRDRIERLRADVAAGGG